MKNLTELNNSTKNNFELQDDTINYISVGDLKKYKETTEKFLMPETRDIIDWLIVNNTTYISDLSNNDTDNALGDFYNSGRPSKEDLRTLWNKINTVVKAGRGLEIPVFLTKDQFDKIINKELSLDSVVIDLTTEEGRNNITKKYQPLIWKIVNQWSAKTVMSREDLYSAASEGFVRAMNTYGKKSKKRIKMETNMTDAEIKDWEQRLHSSMTFGQYAAFMIRTYITETIKDLSRTVRVSRSAQQREKKTNGSIKASNTVSGDSVATTNKDGNTKTLFDFVGSSNDISKKLDNEDLENLWDKVYKKLDSVFDKKIMDIWYSYNGINGYKQLENKDLAKKYNVVPSNITYYLNKVNTYIRKDKTLFKAMSDIYELMKECLNDRDNETDYDIIYTDNITDIQDDNDLDFNEIY